MGMVGNFSFVVSHSASGPAAFPHRNVNSSPCSVSVMSLLHYNFLSRTAAKSMGVEPHEEWLCPWDLGSPILQDWGHCWRYNGSYSSGIYVKMLRLGSWAGERRSGMCSDETAALWMYPGIPEDVLMPQDFGFYIFHGFVILQFLL